MQNIKLGVNIDHIATLRQARLSNYPSLVEAVKIIEKSGADGITLHLREDRRHIQDSDVLTLKKAITTKMNLEMAATSEMVSIATKIKPQDCCIVPEKRQELTTEGGLDVLSAKSYLTEICTQLAKSKVRVSLFIDADLVQIEAAFKVGVPVIELHTGHYANATTNSKQTKLLRQIQVAATYANSLGLQVNAGHGLHLGNTIEIAQITEIVELNIGHAIIARSVFVGLAQSIAEMKTLIQGARK